MSQIWTIGHWTCPESTFIGLLRAQQIELVADVRSHPGSRTSPQFSKDTMRGWLDHAGIGYIHLGELGGRRPKQDVDAQINAGWRHRSFKNYADYTLSPAYEKGITRLITRAAERHVAYLCAEPMPWRCHRLLISNTLTARGFTVWHITGGHHTRLHRLGDWGAVPSIDAAGRLTYPKSRANPTTECRAQPRGRIRYVPVTSLASKASSVAPEATGACVRPCRRRTVAGRGPGAATE